MDRQTDGTEYSYIPPFGFIDAWIKNGQYSLNNIISQLHLRKFFTFTKEWVGYCHLIRLNPADT